MDHWICLYQLSITIYISFSLHFLDTLIYSPSLFNNLGSPPHIVFHLIYYSNALAYLHTFQSYVVLVVRQTINQTNNKYSSI